MKHLLPIIGLCVVLVLGASLRPNPGPVSASGVAAVAAGSSHTCALTTAGGVKCWGDNSSGELGDGTTTERHIPVDVPGLTSGVASVAAGRSHTCIATLADGAKCWGRNDAGQLGNGTVTDYLTPNPTPTDVCANAACDSSLSDVVSIAAGDSHTCALGAAGGVTCWGRNGDGQLGDGTTANRATPVVVIGLESGVAAISAGGFHTCALMTSGGAKCWGKNGEGQLGDGRSCGLECTAPVDVSGLSSGVAAIAAGGLHTCALRTDGGVLCWGFNFDGQVGDGTSGNIRTTPAEVFGLDSGIAAIGANGSFRGHACALTTQGGLKCWGDNAVGQLGDGSTTDRHVPVDVTGLTSGVAAVVPGSGHTCAVMRTGGLKCWGDNSRGQLGDGTSEDRHDPVDVLSLKPMPGDVNCNGNVNSIDAALVLQYVAGLLDSLPCDQNADVNEDGSVNSIDAALILQFVAGLIGGLP